ncbi:protein RALF-like 19 [Lotus japonicus]|uniref:protein RALF-like 19 n=1 Tax=Lotus japonicus TaxID=34305 RepID=UPI0025863806|nr:protein RALF-like 19 [Lotus japonicus]
MENLGTFSPTFIFSPSYAKKGRGKQLKNHSFLPAIINSSKMECSGCWLMLLIQALTLATMAAEASMIHEFAGILAAANSTGGLIEDENKFLMSSQPAYRALQGGHGRQGYISYGSLWKDYVPCVRRGCSYYNCRQRGRANPYRRDCSAATHCARNLN